MNSLSVHSVEHPCHLCLARPSAMPPVWHHVVHHFDGSTREVAKATAHVEASMRVQRCSQAHTWCVMYCGTSRAGNGELSDRVHRFFVPSSARLDGEDHQSAPLGCGQLWVSCFLDMPCSLQCSTIHFRGMRLWFDLGRGDTHPRWRLQCSCRRKALYRT